MLKQLSRTSFFPHLTIGKDDDSRHGGDIEGGRQVAAVLSHHLIMIGTIRGGIKKKLYFFRKTPKGGGRGLAESEIFSSEKTEIFLEFFFERGGGPTYSKRVLS